MSKYVQKKARNRKNRKRAENRLRVVSTKKDYKSP